MVKKVQNSMDVSETAVPHSYTVKITKNQLPTTVKMVDDALIMLHSTKGLTLKQLVSFIAGKYVITLSKLRKSLIKKRLYELKESDDLMNTTGKGLNGHFKLVDKKKFISSSKQSTLKISLKSRKSSPVTGQKTSTVVEPQSPQPGGRKKSSMFDTPSTLLSELSTISMDRLHTIGIGTMCDTPVSSLPAKKKRRLM